jgi:hypothetical protein
MNRRGLANVLIGVVLLCAAGWMLSTGQVIARAPSLTTRENNPIAFWLEFGAFSAFGLLLLAHGTARSLSVAAPFVAGMDAMAARLHAKLLPWRAK